MGLVLMLGSILALAMMQACLGILKMANFLNKKLHIRSSLTAKVMSILLEINSKDLFIKYALRNILKVLRMRTRRVLEITYVLYVLQCRIASKPVSLEPS